MATQKFFVKQVAPDLWHGRVEALINGKWRTTTEAETAGELECFYKLYDRLAQNGRAVCQPQRKPRRSADEILKGMDDLRRGKRD